MIDAVLIIVIAVGLIIAFAAVRASRGGSRKDRRNVDGSGCGGSSYSDGDSAGCGGGCGGGD